MGRTWYGVIPYTILKTNPLTIGKRLEREMLMMQHPQYNPFTAMHHGVGEALIVEDDMVFGVVGLDAIDGGDTLRREAFGHGTLIEQAALM